MTSIHRLKSMCTHILFILLTLVWSYPFIWMISSSFKTSSEMLMDGLSLWPKTWTLSNFGRAWERANFDTYFLNTLVISVSVVALVVLISATSGYALGRGNMPGKRWIVGILVATMFLPKGVVVIPVFKLIHAMGLNNTLTGIILAEAGPAHIVAILLFMGFFAKVPVELEESARMDGAGFLTTFVKVMFPLSAPVIGTVTIFNFIGAWNSFLLPLIFTLSKPELRTLGVGMYSFFGEFSVDWSGFAAGALLSVLPILIVFLLLQRSFIEGLAGAVKG
ncbi:carbohydrate ABC transporter permease [Paenibacillus sp. YYML68]|uniref:carbohydrate ABC transporter permease n=1 Tax=Paenibacillus sp. YYML68 TaxID=2909250 RepID=UPI0024927D30|nr:carbohydrate ABC transporter permease [Paenibacillus sp. YYML68]